MQDIESNDEACLHAQTAICPVQVGTVHLLNSKKPVCVYKFVRVDNDICDCAPDLMLLLLTHPLLTLLIS